MKLTIIFIFSLFLLVLTPIISAQPPFEATVLEQGIDIAFPQIDVLKLNTAFEFHFHVVNKTDGAMLSSTDINCTFHLFNSTGNHLFQNNENVRMDDNGFDFVVNIDKNNFTNVGDYAYLFGCHSPTPLIGGQIARGLEVTQDGKVSVPFPQQFSVIALGIILIMFGLLNVRYSMLKYMGSMILMVMGTLTLYPGYNNISHTTLFGLVLGSILIGLGFWFLIEDSFSREKQGDRFNQPQGERDEEEDEERG